MNTKEVKRANNRILVEVRADHRSNHIPKNSGICEPEVILEDGGRATHIPTRRLSPIEILLNFLCPGASYSIMGKQPLNK